MKSFSAVLALLAAPFKTLPQATEALEPAKATLDSVNALFTAAGLNLEQMLAGGPDALKAHLESLDNFDELSAALLENERIEAELAADHATIETLNANLSAHAELFTAIGFAAKPDATPEQFKASHEAFVSKQTTLALSKTGHPPAHVPASDVTLPAAKTSAELHAEWKAMKPSAERLAFFSQHEAQITAHERSS